LIVQCRRQQHQQQGLAFRYDIRLVWGLHACQSGMCCMHAY
jgi:hypothetical protein